MPDPYSQYGGKVAEDPYAAYQDDMSDLPGITKKGNKSPYEFLTEKLPESLKSNIGDTVSAIKNPIGTVKNIGDAALGGIAHMSGTENKFPEQVKTADAVGNNFKDRYGSLSKVGDTLYNDPVGVAADVSTVLDPVAGGLKLAGAGKVARAAEIARDVTNPVNMVSKPASAAGSAISNLASDKLMKSALNTSGADIKASKIPETANYARSNDLTINRKGKGKVDKLFNQTEPEINRQVDLATIHNPLGVDRSSVQAPVLKLRDELSKGSAPEKYTAPLDKLTDEHTQKFPDNFSPRVAQDAKRADYKVLDYGNDFVDNPIETQGRKALAAGNANEVERAVTAALGQQYPSLSELNISEGNQLRIRAAIKSAMERKNAGLVNNPLGSAASTMASKNPAFSATRHLVPSILADPGFKSELAVILDKAHRGASKVARKVPSHAVNDLATGGKYTINPEEIPEQ